MPARAAILAVALAVPIRALALPDVTIEVHGIGIAHGQSLSSGDLAEAVQAAPRGARSSVSAR